MACPTTGHVPCVPCTCGGFELMPGSCGSEPRGTGCGSLPARVAAYLGAGVRARRSSVSRAAPPWLPGVSEQTLSWRLRTIRHSGGVSTSAHPHRAERPIRTRGAADEGDPNLEWPQRDPRRCPDQWIVQLGSLLHALVRCGGPSAA